MSVKNITSTSDEANEMMDIVAKNTLLVSITIISFFITDGFWAFCVYDVNNVNSQRFILSEHLLGLDAIINSICLILQFKFMTKYYLKLCNPCHAKSLQCCYGRKNIMQVMSVSMRTISPTLTATGVDTQPAQHGQDPESIHV